MSDDQPGGPSGWVVEPPLDGLQVVVELSEGAEITPDLRQALDRLLRVIEHEVADEEAEAQGFQVFRPRPKCPRACPSNWDCRPRESTQCFSFVTCTIVNVPCKPALA